MGRKRSLLLALVCLVFLSACGFKSETTQTSPNTSQSWKTYEVTFVGHQDPTPASTPKPKPTATQTATPTPTPTLTPSPTPTPTQTPPPTNNPPTDIPQTGSGAAPYGPPPALTSVEIELTQQLFAKINSDRAARGLPPFEWDDTLAGIARLHSWNMYHCGFSHTCPDGSDQCTRIKAAGFPNATDCGENIGSAGPSTPPWTNVAAVQQSMVDEGPSGWHFIHLFSTTLHKIGIGVYVDPSGWVWFTEDMVS
uniref:SCP domain-containing protein n=1 Tax=Thermosporothrix sp. COM3 TaxID=2490863 RepID=A0A455SIP8_9CHLR|nr:hypothetical protein KTC_30740 [Thermosporothrix sp. COM3]